MSVSYFESHSHFVEGFVEGLPSIPEDLFITIDDLQATRREAMPINVSKTLSSGTPKYITHIPTVACYFEIIFQPFRSYQERSDEDIRDVDRRGEI